MSLTKLSQYKSNILDKYTYLDLFIIIIIFLFYFSIFLKTNNAKSAYTILAITSVYLIFTRQILYNFSLLEKLFLLSISCSFIWIVITFFVNGMPGKGGHWITHIHLRILMIIPIYLMLRSRPIPEAAFWNIIALGAIVSGVIGISDVTWKTGWPVGRADGDTNAIYFGQISLCFSFITIIGIKRYFSTSKLKLVFCCFAVSLGLLAMILAGSRSAWLAVPLLLLLTTWYLMQGLRYYKKILVMLSLLLIPILLVQFPFADYRIQAVKKNVSDYYQHKNNIDQRQLNSIAIRLNTWDVMLDTIKANPVFGIGLGGFETEMKKYVDKGAVHPELGNLPHSHNQYIEVSLNSGLPGLFFNLCILILPVIIFYKYIKIGDPDVLPFAVTGLSVTIAFLIYGLGDLTLTRKLPIIFFGLTVSILLSFVRQKDTESNSKLISS